MAQTILIGLCGEDTWQQETLQLFSDKNIMNIWIGHPKEADMSPIENRFEEKQKRAKAKFSEIENKDILWDFVGDLIFEDDFIEVILKCYDNIQKLW
jgi:hypothetical protein